MHRSKQPNRTVRRSAGSALITVTLIGLFVMLLAAALVNRYAIAEANAIEESLAKARIYWASMGHVNYALSRISREGLCGGTCVDDGARIDNLRAYLAELDYAGSERNWDYGGGFSFNITATVADGPVPLPNDNDGKVRATISLVPVTGTPFDTLNGIEQRIRGQLVVDVCLAPCSEPTEPTSGANRIDALHRQ